MADKISDTYILSIDFFYDFLAFLNYIFKQPIKRTLTGNISRYDISALSDIFRNGERLKFMDEEKRWPVRSENEVTYLTQIKITAEMLQLIYKRKKELRLSKNGNAFLFHLQPQFQYRAMVLSYWYQVNWEYFTSRQNESVFQKNLNYILKYFLSQRDKWIEFRPFCQSLKDYFHLENQYMHDQSDPDFNIRLDVHYDLIERNLKLFGCVETEEAKDELGIDDIIRFRSTAVGLWVYEEALKQPF